MFCITFSHHAHQYIQEVFLPELRFNNHGLCPSLEKSNIDVREMQPIISAQSRFCSLLCETENWGVFLARSEGLGPLSCGSIFREKSVPQGFRDASCPVHHLKGQLWDWNQCLTGHIQPQCLQTDLWRMAETRRH